MANRIFQEPMAMASTDMGRTAFPCPCVLESGALSQNALAVHPAAPSYLETVLLDSDPLGLLGRHPVGGPRSSPGPLLVSPVPPLSFSSTFVRWVQLGSFPSSWKLLVVGALKRSACSKPLRSERPPFRPTPPRLSRAPSFLCGKLKMGNPLVHIDPSGDSQVELLVDADLELFA